MNNDVFWSVLASLLTVNSPLKVADEQGIHDFWRRQSMEPVPELIRLEPEAVSMFCKSRDLPEDDTCIAYIHQHPEGFRDRVEAIRGTRAATK